MRKQRAKLEGLLRVGRCPTGPRRAALVPGALGCEGSCGGPALVSPRGRDGERKSDVRQSPMPELLRYDD